MARITTTNYASVTDTQFAWATTDNDLFDREQDLYRLAQAVEGHDHSNAKGLAVTRIANNTVTTDNLQALAVTSAKIANLGVTNGKIAADAVTRDKILWPIAQSANTMAGGFSQRDTSNTYAMGFYISANGLAVFGAGTPGGIGANLILDQSGHASIGAVSGSGMFNVMQSTNGAGDGIRIYQSNQTNYFGLHMDASQRLVLSRDGTTWFHIHPTTGFVTIGATASDAARLTVVQSAEGDQHGHRLVLGANRGSGWISNEGSYVLQTIGTTVEIEQANTAFSPRGDGGAGLGRSGRRWSQVYAGSGDFSGNVTISGTLSVGGSGGGTVPLNGIIAFRTAAELSSAGASWQRYTDGDGRLFVGAGTTFSQTFTEATSYGSNWTPLSGSATGGPLETFPVSGGGTQVGSGAHTHNMPTATWLPPMRAVVWGRRNS